MAIPSSSSYEASGRSPWRINWLALLLFPAMLVLVGKARSGEFEVSESCNPNGTNCIAYVRYFGTIELADIEKFRAILRNAQRRVDFNNQIILTSTGGDVEAALRIGRLIRAAHLSTGSVKECYSSCVIILAGGMQRVPLIDFAGLSLGKVGIHRPFLTSVTGGFEEHRERFAKLERDIKRFFREGGVSESLWDDMVKTPPENIKYLNSDELHAYGLAGTDPAYADFMDGKEANRYGISKMEYLRRKSAIKSICVSDVNALPDLSQETLHKSGEKVLKCIDDVYRGRRTR